MISLKKYLEMKPEAQGLSPANPAELLQASLKSYCSLLDSAGKSGACACPAVGPELQDHLKALAERLEKDVTAGLLGEVGSQANQQLQQWGDRVAAYFKERTSEIKELLLVLARTAESVGERDHTYADHFNQFTARLHAISNLEDLTQVRATLVQQATELKTYVDQMEQQSHQLVEQLQTEVSSYEKKLKKIEEVALRDVLTGLANRRGLEEHLVSRIARGHLFCVVMMDLNRLKEVNDKHGHLAGDDLLRQFAEELRSNSRASDVVGRWGGDEFLLIMDGDANGAKAQIERLQKWAFGQYAIRPAEGAQELRVMVDAAIGLAQWQPGETLAAVIEWADTMMYAQKKESARGAGA